MRYLFLYLHNSSQKMMIAWPSNEPLPDIILYNINQVIVFEDMYSLNEYIFENISMNDRFRMHATSSIIPRKLYC